MVEALDAGASRIALIAQDRLVVRRIRALLERVGVAVDDETGWTLSTTRAAARLMAWLRAALPGAGRDACIEALRAERAPAHAVDALEAAWRRQRPPAPHAQAVADDRLQRIAARQPTRSRMLAQWLQSLRDTAPRLVDALAADAAGRQVLDLLGLTDAPDLAWGDAAQHTRFDLAQFIAWVDDSLEGSAWRADAAAGTNVVSSCRWRGRCCGRSMRSCFPAATRNTWAGTTAAAALLPARRWRASSALPMRSSSAAKRRWPSRNCCAPRA